MHGYVAQAGVQIMIINGEKVYVPFFPAKLAYPARCVNTTAKSNEKNAQCSTAYYLVFIDV